MAALTTTIHFREEETLYEEKGAVGIPQPSFKLGLQELMQDTSVYIILAII